MDSLLFPVTEIASWFLVLVTCSTYTYFSNFAVVTPAAVCHSDMTLCYFLPPSPRHVPGPGAELSESAARDHLMSSCQSESHDGSLPPPRCLAGFVFHCVQCGSHRAPCLSAFFFQSEQFSHRHIHICYAYTCIKKIPVWLKAKA